jgi:nucleotide-binding universal stress UspA family protein
MGETKEEERMRILIAYDGSRGSDEALYDLLRAGLPAQADALVVTVNEAWPGPPTGSDAQALRAEEIAHPLAEMGADLKRARERARSLAEVAAERLRQGHQGWTVEARVANGSPGPAVLAAASEWGPDLIVVGPHGHSALGRLIFGSVSRRVLSEAPCSVRVARAHGDSPLRAAARIVVGFDGSEGAQAAARAVAARRWPAGSEARLVSAFTPLKPTAVGHLIPPLVKGVKEVNEEAREEMREAGVAAAASLEAAGLKASSVIVDGEAKEVLLEEAEAWRADCIFVGGRGLNKLERRLIGGVSLDVATHARCSVEVVRPAQARAV